MQYSPSEDRYEHLTYNRCGKSGLLLPPISLGLWHNFGSLDDYEKCRRMVHTAFDSGITHFDLANNYGPPPGSAETTFGKILKQDLALHRDEILISTKAGHLMWNGPYGDWGSRKYLLASLDQSLKRLQLDYVDIFYIHRYDPETPLEETIGALVSAVKSGKALYAAISKFPAEAIKKACRIFREEKVPCVLNQIRYNMLDRDAEQTNLPTATEENLGNIIFSPLAQGMLTERYLEGIPPDSRAAGNSTFLTRDKVSENIGKIRQLAEVAKQRGQRMSHMAISWALSNPHVSSAIIGASKPEQITDCLDSLKSAPFCQDEKELIATILNAG